MPPSERHSHYQLTFAVLAVSVGAFSLLQSLVIPVLPVIQTDLHTDQKTVIWVLTAYLVSASICTPIVGRVGDKVGKQRMLIVVLVALSIGSLIAALATSITPMIIARVIQGVGGGVLALAFGIIRDEFPEEKVPGAVAFMASLVAVGVGLGLILAGPIVSALNHHWLFWFPMIVTALAAVAAAIVVPASRVRSEGQISVLPAVLLSGWLVALLLALSEGQSWGWTSASGLLVVALVVAISWVFVELRSESPLIDMTMMRLPTVWTTNLVALLVGAGTWAGFGFVPQFAQTDPSTGYGFGASMTEAGIILLPLSVTMFLAGLYSTSLARRIGPKLVVVIGCLFVAGAFAIMAFAHSHEWEIYLATAVMGVGAGLVLTCMSNLIVAAVPPEQTGVASGMHANIRTIGGSIGAAAMATIVTASVLPNGVPMESGYTNGFSALMVVMILAAGVGWVIPTIDRDVIGEGPAQRTQAFRAGQRQADTWSGQG